MALNIKKVLVSQPKPASEKSPYFDIAEKYGVEIDFRPFIKVEPLSSKEFRQQRISILDYSAVIFKNILFIESVKYFMDKASRKIWLLLLLNMQRKNI